jgi:hypothetical protein
VVLFTGCGLDRIPARARFTTETQTRGEKQHQPNSGKHGDNDRQG